MRGRLQVLTVVVGLCLLPGFSARAGDNCAEGKCSKASKPAIRIGAVASSPSSVTVFEGLRRYLDRNGLAADYVLFSNYDALVEALHQKQVDIAWNTPLAHAQYHRKSGNTSQTLAMRDVDRDFRSHPGRAVRRRDPHN